MMTRGLRLSSAPNDSTRCGGLTMSGTPNRFGHRRHTVRHVTGQPERIDVDGPWWRGFYQAWSDRDDGDATEPDAGKDVVWSAGYHAGRVDGHVRRGWISPFWN